MRQIRSSLMLCVKISRLHIKRQGDRLCKYAMLFFQFLLKGSPELFKRIRLLYILACP